jgi:hypothetical protein
MNNTRIYTVFTSSGYGGAGNPPESLTTNAQLLQALQKQCPEISFIERDITKKQQSVSELLNEIATKKNELDGVIIAGNFTDYRLAFNGLPTVVAYNLFEFDRTPYKLFYTGKEDDSIMQGKLKYSQPRILTAQLDRRNVTKNTEEMFNDFTAKVKLIDALAKLKKSRILSVSTLKLSQVDYQGDSNKTFPSDYEKRYTKNLKQTLGVDIHRVEPKEFFAAVEAADSNKAQEIAAKWIEEAAEVTDTIPSEVVKTAKAFLAYDALRSKYGCNAVSTHMRALADSGKTDDLFWPGLALECGFKLQGIQAVCQDYPNILITQMIGYFLTGRPSMLGDIMVDTFNNVDILTHCGAPINPFGDNRRMPYIISSHAESPLRGTKKPGSGTGIEVKLPVDETVTVWKVYPLLKKIGIHTGKAVNGYAVYKDFEKIMCRTKLVIQVDAAKIQKSLSPDEYGIHRNATYGDLRDKVKDFAALTSFEVMEEDK